MTELRRCWRCGEMAIYVDKFGIPSETETGFVSCHWTPCMSLSEIYTVEQWQTRAVEDELEKKVAELEAENTFLKNNNTPMYIVPTPQWIPVSVPPKEGKKYWVTGGMFVGKAYYKDGVFYDPKDDERWYSVTHYMERQGKPKPPK